MISNVSWSPNLGYNLISTIFLAKKGIEMFLRRIGWPSEIFFEDKLIRLADMIDNQYVIRLAAFLAFKVNILKNPIPEIWHAWLGHLSYNGMQKFASVALSIEVKGLLP